MKKIVLDEVEIELLTSIFVEFKNSFELRELNFSKNLINDIRAKFGSPPFLDEIREKISSKEYIIVDLSKLCDNFELIDLKKILTFFISLFLTPIGVFGNEGIAREIKVNPSKDPNSSTGIGHIPLHTDFNNTSNPPLFSILYCHRTDPFMGGESIISNFNDSFRELPEHEKSTLSKAIFNEGKFYNLFNVGKKLDKFPVFYFKSNVIRYSTKLKYEKEEITPILWNLRKILIKNQETFMLNKGELLIIDQKVFVHGRHSLNGDQNLLGVDRSRLLIQYFAR